MHKTTAIQYSYTHVLFTITSTHILQVIEELEPYPLVLDPAPLVFVLRALHREVPVEVVGELRAAAGPGNQEAGQIGELH